MEKCRNIETFVELIRRAAIVLFTLFTLLAPIACSESREQKEARAKIEEILGVDLGAATALSVQQNKNASTAHAPFYFAFKMDENKFEDLIKRARLIHTKRCGVLMKPAFSSEIQKNWHPWTLHTDAIYQKQNGKFAIVFDHGQAFGTQGWFGIERMEALERDKGRNQLPEECRTLLDALQRLNQSVP